MTTIAGLTPYSSTPRPPDNTARLRALAQQLEATFLAEMLDHAGLDQTSVSFGGGVGEDQFGSFLRQEQATAMVKAGGIGLAEQFFKAMTGGGDAKRD